jgi:hypothetical protein
MPCPHYDPCIKCQAETWLTSDDWLIVGFYQRVADQYINQPDLRIGKDIPVLTPRLEGYEAVLRVSRYPREMWQTLMDGAAMLHRLVQRMDRVDWPRETGKTLATVRPEDIDGD